MKGDSEDPVCGVEGLLDAVTVVDINVDVQNARVMSERIEKNRKES